VADLKRWGVDILTISLDSAYADEHDHFRGVSGTFEKTVAGIKLALKGGLRVTLGAVVTHQTLRKPGMLALMRMAKNMKVLLYFIFPVPAGRWVDNQSIFLTSEDLAYIDTLTRRSPYLRTDFQANWGALGCGAVKEILYLTPYGDVLPCPFVHISLGNIKNEPLATIRRRALINPYFSQYHPDCLASTDKYFIQRYLSQTFSAGKLPLSYHHVFGDIYNPSKTRVEK
ncbi:MAG: radical SAM protein, partial [Proteobacteria bacterium]|nr:radical SAM protein [Pseudomonadota bacterium]